MCRVLGQNNKIFIKLFNAIIKNENFFKNRQKERVEKESKNP